MMLQNSVPAYFFSLMPNDTTSSTIPTFSLLLHFSNMPPNTHTTVLAMKDLLTVNLAHYSYIYMKGRQEREENKARE